MRYGKIQPVGTNTYANGAWELLSETIVTSTAVSSITISSLEGDTDEVYLLGIEFIGIANSGVRMRFNGDTGNNYGFQALTGADSTLSASRDTSRNNIPMALIAVDDQLSAASALIHATSGVERTVLNFESYSITSTTVTGIEHFGSVWSNTADEITSIVVYSSNSLGIDVGSSVRLWRKV